MSSIILHHLNRSRSSRIIWALEELGLAYELETYARDRKTALAGPEAKAVHTMGRFPMLQIDEQTLVESGAILEYLAERESKLMPTSPEERLQYRLWMHFAEGSMMPPLLVGLITKRLRTGVPFPANAITGAVGSAIDGRYTKRQIKDVLTTVQEHLNTNTYFCGPTFTMADIQMSYPCFAAIERVPGVSSDYPAIQAWCDRMSEREGYRKALEQGGPWFMG